MVKRVTRGKPRDYARYGAKYVRPAELPAAYPFTTFEKRDTRGIAGGVPIC